MELANSIVTLQPGMYILRHPKTGLPPLSISRAAGATAHNGSIQALYTPGTDGSVLRDGKDCIVMQILNAPVDLLVTAYLERAGATVPGLKIDKVKLDDSVAPAKPIEIPPKGISLIGHVERVGDVVATGTEVLGTPKSNLRLEGFQVMWPDRPEGVDVLYSARIEGMDPTPTVSTGHFCGVRGAARRIVGITIALTGPKAGEYDLTGQAHFSGDYVAQLSSGGSLSGPSGLEHLVALQLGITQKRARPSASQGPWEPSARTKVFKSSKTSRRVK